MVLNSKALSLSSSSLTRPSFGCFTLRRIIKSKFVNQANEPDSVDKTCGNFSAEVFFCCTNETVRCDGITAVGPSLGVFLSLGSDAGQCLRLQRGPQSKQRPGDIISHAQPSTKTVACVIFSFFLFPLPGAVNVEN